MARFLAFLAVAGFLTSCWNIDRYRCTYNDPRNVQFRLNSMKHRLDSANVKYCVYRPYNVKLSYLDCFREDTTSGRANFYYFDPVAHKSLRLIFCIRSNNEGWDVRKAIEYELTSPSRQCIAEGLDYYVISGDSYVRKTYLIDDKWLDYSLLYNSYATEAIGRVIDLIKEWNPK